MTPFLHYLACASDPDDPFNWVKPECTVKKNRLLAALFLRHAKILSDIMPNDIWAGLIIRKLKTMHDAISFTSLEPKRFSIPFFHSSSNDDFAAKYHCAVALKEVNTITKLYEINSEQLTKLSEEDLYLFPILFANIKWKSERKPEF